MEPEGGSMMRIDKEELEQTGPALCNVNAPDNRFVDGSGETGDRRLSHASVCDTQLVSAAKSGDHGAFVELCRRHTPSLKRKIWQILRNREDSDDILQETVLRAYKHLAAFQARCAFGTWITKIAINNSLMLVRKRRKHPETGLTYVTTDGSEVELLEPPDPFPNPEEVYAKRQASHRLGEAMRKLSPYFRQVVERYHQDEECLIDAARAIGITVPAAKSRLMRARKALHRHLNNDRS
jgi:RNA polymerase sigma-70 factor (ECF subfamily)